MGALWRNARGCPSELPSTLRGSHNASPQPGRFDDLSKRLFVVKPQIDFPHTLRALSHCLTFDPLAYDLIARPSTYP